MPFANTRLKCVLFNFACAKHLYAGLPTLHQDGTVAIVSPNFPSVRKQKSHPQRGAIFVFGADEQIRTAYLLITNEVLYRLSYISARNEHYSEASRSLQVLISENTILFFDADDTLHRVDAG